MEPFRYPTTLEQYTEKIKKRLGANTIEVELSDDEVHDIITDGLAIISSYSPVTKFIEKEVQAGISEFRLPDDLIHIDYVAHQKVGSGLNDSLISVSRLTAQALFINQEWGNFANFFQIGTIAQHLSYFEQQSRILGLDFTWYRNGKYINIQPTPTFPFKIVICYSRWKDLEDLEPFEHQWLFKFVLAGSKVILGRKYSKFGSTLPVNGGMDSLSLPGSDLISEGISELKELETYFVEKLSAPLRILNESN